MENFLAVATDALIVSAIAVYLFKGNILDHVPMVIACGIGAVLIAIAVQWLFAPEFLGFEYQIGIGMSSGFVSYLACDHLFQRFDWD